MRTSLSVGYAQSHIHHSSSPSPHGAEGVNLKYRYDMNDQLGLAGSYTRTWAGGDYLIPSYHSLLLGPALRLSDAVSVYTQAGMAWGRVHTPGVEMSAFHSTVAYDMGLQLNPLPNVVLDTSLEYARLAGAKDLSWIVGVGYRF